MIGRRIVWTKRVKRGGGGDVTWGEVRREVIGGDGAGAIAGVKQLLQWGGREESPNKRRKIDK
jgi:hypothetical protein